MALFARATGVAGDRQIPERPWQRTPGKNNYERLQCDRNLAVLIRPRLGYAVG